ncbi:MAG: hypothetical protein COY58_02270 [Gammaproteobacteria bacterium CG_4_10_14_0_8_um_filter_38_16]|nr:MAG: hypothetical protein COY58_02270 [Gammaproteobacteria bacterium CG_4_10_14_0_8_um_filter_38_16]PJA03760.1 MAG: hypothetical protein COX72_02430 [Gammaproteobacteria bacterium CG_4_10_14_0_2_um_filter_38_22]PJB10570.1 MAG: hypothetical protein CO120_04150 [Gammaproteobacteria bacterium CG_4_9_14_3_um_filter_38_9]
MSHDNKQQGRPGHQQGRPDHQQGRNPQGAGEQGKKNPNSPQQPRGQAEFKDPRNPTPNKDHK